MLEALRVLFPVTMMSSEDVIPAELRVPVMSAGPPTTKFAVASRLETEMVLGSRALLRVPEVTFDAFSSDKASPDPMKSVAFTFPATSNFWVGCVVPMPRFSPIKTLLVTVAYAAVSELATFTLPDSFIVIYLFAKPIFSSSLEIKTSVACEE